MHAEDADNIVNYSNDDLPPCPLPQIYFSNNIHQPFGISSSSSNSGGIGITLTADEHITHNSPDAGHNTTTHNIQLIDDSDQFPNEPLLSSDAIGKIMTDDAIRSELETTHAWWSQYVTTCDVEEDHLDRPSKVNEYRICDKLGNGSFATVYQCQREVDDDDTSTFRKFALKMFDRRRLLNIKNYKTVGGRLTSSTAMDKVYSEFEVMKHLFHRNIMLLFEMIDDEDSDYAYMVLELWDGGQSMTWDSEEKIFVSKQSGGSFEIETARQYMADIASGLAYLKQQGVIHRDIKPDNVLINKEGDRCAISDFGCAKYVGKDSFVHDTDGTIAFFPPEACSAEEPYDAYAADVWSSGVTLYAFLVGKLPFYSDSPMGMLDAIKNDVLIIPDKLPDEASDLLLKLLEKDPSKRIIIEEVLLHPWVLPKVADDNIPIMNTNV